jgi:signal recognition particle subunit SRP54
LDGHAKGGGVIIYNYLLLIFNGKALSAVAATESPIIFIGSGEHFNDLEPFDAQSFIKRLLGLGDVSKLFNTVKDAVSQEEQSKMLDNLKSGNFTLNDLKS